MPTSALILTAVILVGVLGSDLGRRAITAHRLIRPLIVAGVAARGERRQVQRAGTGVLLGLLAASLVRLEHEPATGRTFTRAGIGYALIWIATAAARLAFIYGSSHWFSANLDSWMLTHHITADALTDALIVMALAMTSARTLSLIVRSRLTANPQSRRVADAGVA